MRHEDVGGKKDLVLYRLETARENLRAATILLDAGEFKSANNRAYYAIFHAITAVQALDGKAYKTHKETLGNFNKRYFGEGVFPRELGHRVAVASIVRRSSDYDDFYQNGKEYPDQKRSVGRGVNLPSLVNCPDS